MDYRNIKVGDLYYIKPDTFLGFLGPLVNEKQLGKFASLISSVSDLVSVSHKMRYIEKPTLAIVLCVCEVSLEEFHDGAELYVVVYIPEVNRTHWIFPNDMMNIDSPG